MKKSVLSALMVCSITLTSVALPSAAFADEYDTKIQQQDQKINALTSQMSDAEAKVAAIENDMVERTSYHQKYLNYIVKFLI